MAPLLHTVRARASTFQPVEPSREFSDQWTHPGDVFSVLLILGGDVVGRALAQLTGHIIGPPSFSFGWVAYSINALISAVGENRLMPLPDCSCLIINGKTGYARRNTSWILGRMVRDYDYWMHEDVHTKVAEMLQMKWEKLKNEANEKGCQEPEKPTRAGLCVSIYKPIMTANLGKPVDTLLYSLSVVVAILQLSIAAIPCGIFGDWGILMITATGILLSCVTASLPQWRREKWACRLLQKGSHKEFILTTGNGSQHAIVILGEEGFLDLEDLATGQTNVNVSTSTSTRGAIAVLALLWILLLVTAAGLKKNTWFLLAIGGIGTLLNIYAAGHQRHPRSNGLPIQLDKVIGDMKAMKTLIELEEAYPGLGSSMLAVFFPGKLLAEEEIMWDDFEKTAKARAAAMTGR